MTITFRPAVREATPLLIGLIGPTWTGKTYSALRLATGIVKARGGKIIGIDTEARRMLQYANDFTFDYLEFGEPFSSLSYAEVLRAAAVAAQGGCVIVDSMSHEHEGMGGYLDFHENEVQRLVTSGGFRNEYAANIPAWNKPSQERRKLINTVLQLNCAFIFCFRAKEKIKLATGGKPVEQGWQAIAGEEFGFEMTLRCLLTPGAKGVPDWSEPAQKLGVPKRIKEHEDIVRNGAQLSEEIGFALAQSAAGVSAQSQAPTAPPATTPKESHGPVMGRLESAVIGKSGGSGASAWQAYNLMIDGQEYLTINEPVYELANEAISSETQVEFFWSAGKNSTRKIDKMRICAD